MVDIRDYNKTASSNTDLFPEGMAPSALNDGGRAVQAELAQEIADESGTLTLGGTATAYTLTLNTGPTSLADGLFFSATANVTNTGGATTLVVTPNGGSAFASKKVKVYQSGAEGDPTAGSIIANNHYLFQYDSAADSGAGAFILLNPSSQGVVLLASGTVSGAATLDLTLPAGYRSFDLELTECEPVSSATPAIRFSYDNLSTVKSGASDYVYGADYVDSSGSNGVVSVPGGDSLIAVGASQSAAGGHGGTFRIFIETPDVSGHYTAVDFKSGHYTAAGWRRLDGGGRCTASSNRATNIRFLYSTGVNISGARWQLYGRRA